MEKPRFSIVRANKYGEETEKSIEQAMESIGGWRAAELVANEYS